MKDLLLDKSGDLALDEFGDVQITDSVKQAIAVRLRWFANEWKLGPNFGLPYYEDVFVKNPSYELIENRMRETIVGVDGVEQILSFEIAFDRKLRKIEIRYTVSVVGTGSDNGMSSDSIPESGGGTVSDVLLI